MCSIEFTDVEKVRQRRSRIVQTLDRLSQLEFGFGLFPGNIRLPEKFHNVGCRLYAAKDLQYRCHICHAKSSLPFHALIGNQKTSICAWSLFLPSNERQIGGLDHHSR